jgi:exonuclease SbcD
LRLMHLADLHLGAPCGSLGELAPFRQEERDALFRRLMDIAINEADLLIISGDLFDRHDPEENLVHYVMAQLRRLQEAGKPVIIVPGNHDEITYAKSVYVKYGAWPCVVVMNPRPCFIFDKKVAGVDLAICSCAYTGGVTTKEDLQKMPPPIPGKVNICAFHATLDIKMPSADDDRSMLISSDILEKSGYVYAALGHIHKPSENKAGGCCIVYPGLLDAMGFGDTCRPEIAIVELSQTGMATLTWRRVDGLKEFKTIEIDASGEIAQSVASKVEALASSVPYLRVKLKGSISRDFNIRELEAAIKAKRYYAQVEDELLRIDDQELRTLAATNTVAGIFVRNMLELQMNADLDYSEILSLAIRKGLDALS